MRRIVASPEYRGDTRWGPQIFAGDPLKLNGELRSFRG